MLKVFSFRLDSRIIDTLVALKESGYGASQADVLRRAVALASVSTPGACADAYAEWLRVGNAPEEAIASAPEPEPEPVVYHRAPRPGTVPAADLVVTGTMLCAQEGCETLRNEGDDVFCDTHKLVEVMHVPEF